MKRDNVFNLPFTLAIIAVLILISGCERNDSTGVPVMEAPVIVSQSVTDIYSAGATLKARLKENGLPVTVTFEYGPDLSYGNSVQGVDDPVYDTGINVKTDISALTKGTTYHFRTKAVNQAGTTYGNDIEFVAAFGLAEAHGGGFIIWLDESGEHGLIAADTDQSTGIIWDPGTNCKKTNVTSTALGRGQSNTTRIVSTLGLGNYPAKICDDLDLNGYDDWFLPSLQELDCLCKALSASDKKYRLKGHFYWTSSEAIESEGTQSCSAWVQNINTSEQRTWVKDDNTPFVRAVRAF